MTKDTVKLDRDNGTSLFRRFFHIGPLLTICKSIAGEIIGREHMRYLLLCWLALWD